jgi:hypothetical protein
MTSVIINDKYHLKRIHRPHHGPGGSLHQNRHQKGKKNNSQGISAVVVAIIIYLLHKRKQQSERKLSKVFGEEIIKKINSKVVRYQLSLEIKGKCRHAILLKSLQTDQDCLP